MRDVGDVGHAACTLSFPIKSLSCAAQLKVEKAPHKRTKLIRLSFSQIKPLKQGQVLTKTNMSKRSSRHKISMLVDMLDRPMFFGHAI